MEVHWIHSVHVTVGAVKEENWEERNGISKI